MTHHEQDDMTVRVIPAARWAAIGWLVLVVVLAAMAGWEWRMRSLGLHAGDLGDGVSYWTAERRKLAAGQHDGVVIFGSSNINHWRPWTDAPNEVVYEKLACQPCAGYFCKEFDAPQCILSVKPESVIEAIEKVLSKK